MSLRIVFMFSGQGSQYYQMGKGLFEANLTFRKNMLDADIICQDLIGTSVIEHLYNKENTKSTAFTSLLFSHPAIFMVEYALTQVLLERNIQPDLILGVSLGEITAAVIAGSLTLEAALKILLTQAQSIEQNCNPGCMLAVLHDYNLYHNEPLLNLNSELAAINFASHFVISGSVEQIQEITVFLNKKNITSQLLATQFGFHSSFIDKACEPFLEAIKSIPLKEAKIPIISCTHKEFFKSFSSTYLWEIVRFPILFESTIKMLEEQQPSLYVDLGPSGTLATFIKYNMNNNSSSQYIAVLTPYGTDTENLEKALRASQIPN